jgi:Spy/CpxP family protein refolding chaperone
MRLSRIGLVLALAALASTAFAQGVTYQDKKGTAGWQDLGPSGTWWRTPRYISMLSLTTDQQKRMDDVFQQFRIKLIDLTATLDKEEAILEPLIKTDRLDEIRVGMQLDKVADARAELEKANGRMLLGIRQVLTPEQWTKLNSSPKAVYSYYDGLYKSKVVPGVKQK